MADLRDLKDRAAGFAAKGKLEKAVEAYQALVAATPKDPAARQRLAEVLRRSGRVAEAVASYAEVATRFAEDGLLIKAIAICKTILELDPSHVATQAMLADLYGKRGTPPAVLPQARPPAPPAALAPASTQPPPRGAPPPLLVPPIEPDLSEDVPLSFDEPAEPQTPFTLIMSAAHEALAAGVADDLRLGLDLDESAGPSPGDEPAFGVELEVELPELPADAVEPLAPTSPHPRLPQVALFSDLGRDALLALTEGLVLRRFDHGEAVLREGEGGTSFFVVATGAFTVWKRGEGAAPVVLAHLGEGDFFGEMALLSGAPRSATVTADGPGEVLELPAALLQEVASRHPHVASSLRRFYRQRLLANAIAVSPLFRPFERAERARLASRFRTREVAAGEVLVREGEPSDGLYLVLEGAVDVWRRQDGRPVLVGRLREGELFGEVSCLRKTPATASVSARRAGTCLRLPRADFDALVTAYPQVLELVADLTADRLERLAAMERGRAGPGGPILL